MANQSCRDYSRIVADEHVAATEQVREAGERPVLPRAVATIDHHQSRMVARIDRVLSDQVAGKVEIERIGPQA
jgi:hypothetical protein